MADFQPASFVTIRQVNGLTVFSNGVSWQVDGPAAGPADFHAAADLLTNSRHYLRAIIERAGKMADLVSGALAGVVTTTLHDKPAQIMITADQFAAVKVEADRYAQWQADAARTRAAQQETERAYDLGANDGGEGYNPHRLGDRPTYRRSR